MITVVWPAVNFFRALLIWASVPASTEDVESSRTKIGESVHSVLAIAIRCRCPPDNPTPLSPSSESHTPVQILMMKKVQMRKMAMKMITMMMMIVLMMVMLLGMVGRWRG